MMATNVIFQRFNKLSFISCRKLCSTQVIFNKPQSITQNITSGNTALTGNVPGLSSAVVQFGDDPVGPGAGKSTEYKNPEYFCYHSESYYEAEIEMLKYRCPQPSSKM